MINFLLPSLWTTPTLNCKSKNRALEEFSIKIRAVHKVMTRIAELWVLRLLWSPRELLGALDKSHLKLRAYVNMLFALGKPHDWQEVRTACNFREKEKVTEEAVRNRHITMSQVNAVHGSCARDVLM